MEKILINQTLMYSISKNLSNNNGINRWLSEVLLVISLLSVYAFHVFNIKMYLFVPLGIGVMVYFKKLLTRSIRLSEILFLILIFFTYLNSLVSNPSDPPLLFAPFLVAILGMMTLFLQCKQSSVILSIIFFCYSSFFFFSVMSFDLSPDLVFEGSQNRVFTGLLSLFSLFLMSVRNAALRLLPWKFIFVKLGILSFVSLVSGDVSGSLISITLFYLFLVFWVRLYHNAFSSLLIGLVVAAAVSCFWVFAAGNGLGSVVDIFPNLNEISEELFSLEHFSDNVRLKIWISFFNQMTPLSLIFGSDLSLPLFENYSFHSSILLTVARGGLWGIALLGMLIYAGSHLWRANRLVSFGYLAVLGRGLTETAFFATSASDLAVVGGVLIFVINKKKSS